MKLSGAQVILECLKEQGVDTIFGYPGGAVIPLYDALYDEREYFNHIRTVHEQGAVHAADGYARTTNKVGVCFVTSGPGATNTVTGIATAYIDSIPLVVITGQVPTKLLGKDSFQEVDITSITLPITKHNYIVESEAELADTIREAFVIANSDRPGPVLVDIPKDILLKRTEYLREIENKKDVISESSYKKNINIENSKILEIAKLINNSEKPVIYAGGGIIISEASEKLYSFAKKGDIPVVSTLMGLGGFPREDELSLGLVGMHGFREANLAVTNSDLIIAVGSRFSDRVIGKVEKFAPRAKIIHIDIDSTEIGKNLEADISINGDVNNILGILINHINITNRKEWKNKIEEWKINVKYDNDFVPQNILNKLNQYYKDKVIVSTDVGQHQLWTAQHWKFNHPKTFVSSGGLGTMGYGLGAAIGAKIGNKDKEVLLITGDGSFRMNCNELATVSKYNIPITIVLFNNNTLGMVRQWQRLFKDERYSETDVGNEVDYIKLAEAFGIKGYKINDIGELENTLINIEKCKEPVLIECIIDKDEGVYPIVPAGESIDNMKFKNS